jgi:hypothetical protein
MKIHFLNFTSLVHEIRIPKKGFETVASYRRLKKSFKLRQIRKNPRFFVEDIKKRKFAVIEIDDKKYNLKEKIKRLYLEDFEKLVKQERNSVLMTFLRFKSWLEKYISKNKLPIDIGGNRFPIVRNVLKKSLFKLITRELKRFYQNVKGFVVKTMDGEYEIIESEMLEDLVLEFFKNFGVGEVWGKRLKTGDVLSVWVVYYQPSDAIIYRGENSRIFVL